MPKNKKIGTAQQRKDYTHYRDIIRKRLKRLELSGYAEEPLYYQNLRLLKKLRDIERESQLKMLLRDMKAFIFDMPSTVNQYREERKRQISAIDFLLIPGGAVTKEQETRVLQFRVDMSAKTAEDIKYVLTYPYISREIQTERIQQIREDFAKWQRERGY